MVNRLYCLRSRVMVYFLDQAQVNDVPATARFNGYYGNLYATMHTLYFYCLLSDSYIMFRLVFDFRKADSAVFKTCNYCRGVFFYYILTAVCESYAIFDWHISDRARKVDALYSS